MSNPSNRPGAYALVLLTSGGVTGLLMVVLVVYFGFHHPVNPALLDLVTVFSVVALLAGLGGLVHVSRETKAWQADPARMGPVLARWTYARDEWEAYTERECDLRRRGAWGFGAYTGMSGCAVAVALWTLALAAFGAVAATWAAMTTALMSCWVPTGRRSASLRPSTRGQDGSSPSRMVCRSWT